MQDSYFIDINCDMGESYGNVIIGHDAAIFPYITSCNIACGFHGGDAVHMEKTVLLALKHGVRIGAHPSYPDRENFGRKAMQIPLPELKAVVRYQLAALIGVTKALGGAVKYVKPHGALYNTAADNKEVAIAIVESVQSMDVDLAVMGLPQSAIEEVTLSRGMTFVREAFADRRYHRNGRLISRDVPGAVIEDPHLAAQQGLAIVVKKAVTSIEGDVITIDAQSICVHGDHPNTPAVLKAIDILFKEQQIRKRYVVQ